MILETLNSCVWGLGLTTLLLSAGALFFVKLKLYIPKNFLSIFSNSLKGIFKSDGKDNFKTLFTALGATMGTGNIVGVVSAIAIGGEGSVFWMWMSAILGMATAYAENYLSAKYSKNNCVGACAYLRYGLNCITLSKIFGIFAIFATLGMGSMAQSNTLAQSLNTAFNIPSIISGMIAAIFVFFIISGGAKRLKNACVAIVPMLSVAFMTASIVVIALCFENIPNVFFNIFSKAFDLKAILGGLSGSALGIGLRRGVFSNEAGLGSSPFFHSASENKNPKELGCLAAFEVFVDTIICCTLTSLAVLSADAELDVIASFSKVFGDFSKYIVAIMLALFALATILGWSLCGEKAIVYLLGQKSVKVFRFLFCASIFLGAFWKADFVWTLSDIFNGLMAYPNLFGLFALNRHVKFD